MNFEFELHGRKVSAGIDNCGVSLFRKEPEKDYIDVWVPGETEADDEHNWIFNNRNICLWMAGVAIFADDLTTIKKMDDRYGSFEERMGWRPKTYIEDTATPLETDLWVEAQLGDLRGAKGPDDLAA